LSNRKIAIIGGGPGGYVAAIRASQLGAEVTLVEKNMVGGTCLNFGCIPTKVFLHEAWLFGKIRQSSVFGTLIDESFAPFEEMIKRKEKVVKSITNGVVLLLKSNKINIIKAEAELIDQRKLLLNKMDGGKETLTADRIIIASGSKVSTPNKFIPDGESIITSNEALIMETLPRKIIIIGGGYIGIEFATFFNAVGTEVTIIEKMDSILSGLDEELIRNTKRFLEQRGIKIHTGTTLKSIEKTRADLLVKAASPIEHIEASVDKVLLATGRVPNIDPYVTKIGIDFTPKGIKVNKRMETNIPGIYAVGDVIGGIQLAHVATEEGEIAAENAMGINREINRNTVCFCVFTNPEIASIGLSEREARKRGPVTIGRFPFRSNPTAIIHEETDGFIKVVIDRESDIILGVHILGHEASTLLSTASNLIFKDIKGTEFAGFMQAHPTASEALKEAFLCAYGKAIHAPKTLKQKA